MFEKIVSRRNREASMSLCFDRLTAATVISVVLRPSLVDCQRKCVYLSNVRISTLSLRQDPMPAGLSWRSGSLFATLPGNMVQPRRLTRTRRSQRTERLAYRCVLKPSCTGCWWQKESFLKPNQTVIAALKAEGLPVTAIETPGHHQWPVWRDNLIHFAPLLFQK
jgi:hypothetical protein